MNALKAPGIKFGLISGATYVVIICLLYAGGMETFQGLWRFAPVAFMAVFGLMAGLQERKLSDGFISFGRAVIIIETVFIISELLFNVCELVLYNVVDPDLHLRVKEHTVQATEEMINTFKKVITYQDGDAEEIMSKVQGADYHINIYHALKRFVAFAIYDFLFALLLAIIIRKEPKSSDPVSN